MHSQIFRGFLVDNLSFTGKEACARFKIHISCNLSTDLSSSELLTHQFSNLLSLDKSFLYCLIFVSQMAIKRPPISSEKWLFTGNKKLQLYGNTLKTDIYGFLLFYVHVQIHEKLVHKHLGLSSYYDSSIVMLIEICYHVLACFS